TVVPEDTPMAVIVGGVVGGILVLATVAAVVGVLIWKKRNPRYEKPLPRRERESDAYTGLQPTNNDTGRQPPAGIANPQNSTGHGESDHPHSYMEVLPPDNTYDPLQMTRRQDTAVYTDLRPTGSGGRGTGDNVIITCNAHGRPAPSVTLHKANGELLNEVGNTPSDEHDKTVSSTLVGVTSEAMGTYTCTADNNFTSPEQDKVQLNVTSIVEDPSLPVVICSIKPLDVPHDRLGVYRVEVSNGLEGTYKYFFQVRHATLPSKGGDPFPYWAIIVIVLILTLAAVGIAVARRVFKGKHTATKDSTICTCSAVWDPDPDLYKLKSNVTVTTQHNLRPSKGGDPSPYWAIIVIVLIVTLATAGIVVANHPPQKPPFIANSRQSKFLPVGGTVTCTVQGGKPLVTAVHFNCTNQHLTNDVSKPVGTSVSSSVTISTTQTTDDDTTCYCWATWEPEPGLYTLTSQKSFQIA
ncbi:hypothetical protein BaRGS_00030414, partial [Batillaria attramentaria]